LTFKHDALIVWYMVFLLLSCKFVIVAPVGAGAGFDLRQ